MRRYSLVTAFSPDLVGLASGFGNQVFVRAVTRRPWRCAGDCGAVYGAGVPAYRTANGSTMNRHHRICEACVRAAPVPLR